MSRIPNDTLERSYTTTTHDGWEERRAPVASRPAALPAPPTGLLLGGLVVLGLGALAMYYLGPDLVRYLKIKRM